VKKTVVPLGVLVVTLLQLVAAQAAGASDSGATIAPAPATASATSSGGGHAFLIFVFFIAIAIVIVAGALAFRRFAQGSSRDLRGVGRRGGPAPMAPSRSFEHLPVEDERADEPPQAGDRPSHEAEHRRPGRQLEARRRRWIATVARLTPPSRSRPRARCRGERM
jgi:hypothetical protein